MQGNVAAGASVDTVTDRVDFRADRPAPRVEQPCARLALYLLQTGPVTQCFAYGRDYEPASNPYPLAAPYLASTYDILGGRCHKPCA